MSIVEPGTVLVELSRLAGETTLRATVVLGGALGLALVLRSGPAAARHLLWTATFAVLLALPLLTRGLPTVEVPVPGGAALGEAVSGAWIAVAASRTWMDVEQPGVASRGMSAGGGSDPAPGGGSDPARMGPSVTGSVEGGQGSVTGGDSPPREAGPEQVRTDPLLVTDGGEALVGEGLRAGDSQAGTGRTGRPGAAGWLLALWFVGFGAVATPLIGGLRGAGRLRAESEPATGPRWTGALERGRRTVGVHRDVELRLSPEASSPMAGGVRRPVIILPASAAGWDAQRLDIVLAHELVHLRRRDPLRQIAGRVVAALYWFHPLVWPAVRKAAMAREEACDEAVVALGHRPSTYARHLVELSAPAAGPLPALSSFNRSHLERRIMSIVHPPSRDRTSRWSGRAVLALALSWMLAALVLVPVDRAQAATEQLGGELSPPSVPSVPVPEPAPVISIDGPRFPTPPPPAVEHPAPPVPGPLAAASDCDPPLADLRQGHRVVDDERRVVRVLGGLVVCLLTQGPVELSADGARIDVLGDGARVVLAVESEEGYQRLVMTPDGDGFAHDWEVDGTRRPFDGTAREWRDAALGIVGGQVGIAELQARTVELQARMAREEREHHGEATEVARRQQAERLAAQAELVRRQAQAQQGFAEVARARVHLFQLQSAREGLAGLAQELEAAREAAEDPELRERLEGRLHLLQGVAETVQLHLAELDLDGLLADLEAVAPGPELEESLAGLRAEQARAAEAMAAATREMVAQQESGEWGELRRELERMGSEFRERSGQLEVRTARSLQRLQEILAELY